MPSDKFYTSPEWRALRAAFLRSNPRCAVPGCKLPATHADHIQSRRSGGAALDPRNLSAYCASHHNAKTARLDRPAYRANTDALVVRGSDEDGWPLDPRRR